MSTKQTQPIPGNPPPADNTAAAGMGLSASGGVSKADRIAALMSGSEMYAMGVEFKLFARLLIVERGVMSGTYQQLGLRLATDPRNIKGWAKRLEQAGRISVQAGNHGRMDLRLCEPYMTVAASTDEMGAPPTDAAPLDPELMGLVGIWQSAKAAGAVCELNVKKIIDHGQAA